MESFKARKTAEVIGRNDGGLLMVNVVLNGDNLLEIVRLKNGSIANSSHKW